jgi:hypothetical protein
MSASSPYPPPACACERPIPEQRAEWKGMARTIFARCGLPVPLRLGSDHGK